MSFDPRHGHPNEPAPAAAALPAPPLPPAIPVQPQPEPPAAPRMAWRTTEIATLRALYPQGGAAAVVAALPHRTLSTVRARARLLGVRCLRPSNSAGKRFARLYPERPDIDALIRERYATATAKGAIKPLAAAIGRPYWWVQRRAAQLGVTRNARTRLDVWRPEELAILEQHAACRPKVIAGHLRRAGWHRTETAVAVKLKRSALDREDPDRWSATAVAPLLGVHGNTVADWIERRGLPAQRLNWGPSGRFEIERAKLRRWIQHNPQWIDLRRVDQTWFKELMWGK